VWDVVKSVLSAAFGVQSNQNREHDFTNGKFYKFAIGGVIFTLLFMLGIYWVVSIVTSTAT